MKNRLEHIKYLEEKLDEFLLLKNHTPHKTRATDNKMQSVIAVVRGYILSQNPELYCYADANVDDSECFSDKYFGEELKKLIDNLKLETN